MFEEVIKFSFTFFTFSFVVVFLLFVVTLSIFFSAKTVSLKRGKWLFKPLK